ncbi:MAG: PilZ domain-containing protein [Candidatus Omnitrophica bacterium]|nr:PilZ domain-containing protein [Candidatus Omnitrophota bacterium]
MQDYRGPERRRFQREKAHFLINFAITQPPEVIMRVGQKSVEAVMLDLSEGGLALVGVHEVSPGAKVEMKWTLINPHAVAEDRIRDFILSGEVRDCTMLKDHEYRLGITFLDAGGGDRKAIREFVAANRRKE